MFVNKINGVSGLGFKSYQHKKNNVGETIMRFNYPYDYKNEDCEIQIFKVFKTDNYNHKLEESPIAKIQLKPEGVDVNIQELTNLDKNEAFAYKVVRKEKGTGKVIWEGADTGVKIKKAGDEYVFRVDGNKDYNRELTDVNPIYVKNFDGSYALNDKGEKIKKDFDYEKQDYKDPIANYGYTLITRNGTTPMVQGAGYLIMPDSLMPGAKYKGFDDSDTGEVYYDANYQKKMEGVIKTFSNVYGGSMAGIQKTIPYLKQNGYKVLFSTPIANGSKGWSLGYWNKNNMQVSPNMGNSENFNSLFTDLYKNGMKYVYDGTYTSEGLEGIHFQYALRWAQKNPQSYYWFRMSGLKNSNLGFGVIPKNKENLRHRVVNSPYNYELQANGTYKKVANPDYDKNKETLFQIYDASQASDEQVKALDKAIENYENITSGNELSIITHDDTIINYVFQIDPKEYDNRINVINDLNKKEGKDIKLDTPDGTIMAAQFSNFRIDKKTEGGFVAWDANTDMVKMNYHISNYDEKMLQAITDKSQRDYEKQLIERGTKEVQDMAVQAGKYWTQKVKDIQTIYTARTVGLTKTIDGLDKLVEEGKLPEESRINSEALTNILNGQYLLKPVGVMTKNDVTVKALMKLPLDALEFGENTVGVLSTSYFSNRATTDETIGVSRFDLMKQKNPHLIEPYKENYEKVNNIFNDEIKNFADKVINEMNINSNEKLLDSKGDYTEYGEYVMEFVGHDIAKFALLKSLTGDNLKSKILKNGDITYDYDKLKASTTLQALGINAHNPKDEALQLRRKIENGLKKLSTSDVSFVAEAMSKRIAVTDTMSFRLAEAIVDKASLGLDWRLDAAKDVMDQDAVRNEDNAFDDVWDDTAKFWAKFVKGIKSENPNSYIVAEITDIPDLMKDTYGINSCPYNGETDIGQKFNGEPDALIKFFNETGITTEAGYSYFYTDLLKIFSPEFEYGNQISPNHDSFKNRFDLLLQTRSIDYLRNLYTFLGNHDKPRLLHCLSLDMGIFHANILGNYDLGHKAREAAISVISGAKSSKDIPIELRLNVDNFDYFKTVNTRAIAMSKLLMDSVYEDLNGIASEEDKKRIVNALVDLANGNYLGKGENHSLTRFKVKELSNLEDAFKSVLTMAEVHGLKLTDAERNELIKNVVDKANSMNLSQYIVNGDFDWQDLDAKIKKTNNGYAADILGNKADYSEYSLYTVQLARLLKDSYKQTGKYSKAESAIFAGLKDFAEKYNKKTVDENKEPFRTNSEYEEENRKNGYAAKNIRTAITMAIKQAEFKDGKPIANSENIINTVYQSATEPAVEKLSMIMAYLGGLFGLPTNFAGDELGQTAYEEKAKNIYLPRNVVPWEQLKEKNLLGNYVRNISRQVNGALSMRSDKELSALNSGTPYALDVCTNSRNREAVQRRIQEINKLKETASGAERVKLDNEQRQLCKDLAKIAYMMQDANGNATVSIFYAGDIDHGNRVDYFDKFGLNTEAKRKKFFEENGIETINNKNKYVPIQDKAEMDYIILGSAIALPVGTVFANSNVKDTARYVVKKIGDQLGIVKEGGGKIILNGKTSKHGVMILKKLAFRGNSRKVPFNSQYHFASNPYREINNDNKIGQNLSIISK